MRFLFFAVYLLSSACSAGEPPFSNLYRRPSLSPYIIMSDIDMPYHMGVRPLIQQNKQEQMFKNHLNEKSSTNSETVREKTYMPNCGIRSTGHKTYFMLVP